MASGGAAAGSSQPRQRRHSSMHEAAMFTNDTSADRIVDTLLSQGAAVVLKDIAAAEAFLRGLPDGNYDCKKVNRRGRRQRRLLGLRATRIINARPDGNVTKSFHYNEVAQAILDDPMTLRIQYKTDHAFVYIMVSAAALQLKLPTILPLLCRSLPQLRAE